MKTTPMKITVLTCALTVTQHCLAQGFVNLDFEHPVLPLMPSEGFLQTSDAIPGWTTYFNGSPQSTIYYNTMSLGGALVALEDSNATAGPLPIQGNYSVLLQGSVPGQASSVAVGQTGTIPVTAQSLTFLLGNSFGMLQVSFNGQNISYGTIGTGANYTIYGANIASFAGQTGELLFTAPVQNAGLLDNIQFTSSPVPEPNALALTALGGLIFFWQCGRKNFQV